MGHYGKIEGNSSLAFQHNIVSFGGIIDELDTNTIQIKMFNFGTGTLSCQKGGLYSPAHYPEILCAKYTASVVSDGE